jgi:hypothetical protein
MSQTRILTPRTRRLLDIQGFDAVDAQELAPVAPWLRLAFGLCALLGGVRPDTSSSATRSAACSRSWRFS